MNKKTVIIIAAVVIVCAAAFGGWMVHSAKIDKMRSAGIKQLRAAVALDDYREEQQAEVNKILSDGEAEIKKSSSQSDIDKAVNDAKASVGEIKTSAQLDAEEGAVALEQSVSLGDYRDEQKKEVSKILDAAKASIAEADSAKAIQDIIKDAKKKIAKIKTDKQLTAEEKKAAEEAAAQAAAAAAANARSSGSSNAGSSNANGCVGNNAANFY